LTPPGKNSGDLNPRITQFVCVDLNNASGQEKLMYFFNTHFAYDLTDANSNATKTIAYMKRIIPNGETNYLMAGDLNAEPGSYPIQLLRNSNIMIDLWEHMWATVPGLTFPSTGPTKRIDYFWTSPTLANLCKQNFLFGAVPNPNGVHASDHIGLCAVFDIQVPNL